MYYVYIHTVPNGKIYIGESKNPPYRWLNGEGYKDNAEFYNAIQIFGWNNIKHEIISEHNSEKEAQIYEAVLICYLNAEDPSVGYNNSTIKNTALTNYTKRRPVHGISFDKDLAGKNIFEQSGLPVSACAEMIQQWVFNEKNRSIAHDRLINGMQFADLAVKYGLSIRQLKNIVSDCIKSLEPHL